MENSKLKLILASASPRRKELLGHLKLPFEIVALSIPEISSERDPAKYCQEIAIIKGRAVLENLRSQKQDLLIVSADTVVALDGKIYGKPADRNEAREFLNDLSGRTHEVFTGVSVLLFQDKREQALSFIERSLVSFEAIPSELMEKYLDTGDALDKAGAYGIQGPSLTFVSKVEGSYSNVVGFPLSRFVREIDRFLGPKLTKEQTWFDLF
jgi:septum formation protein